VGFDNPSAPAEVVPVPDSVGTAGYLEGDWGAGDLKFAKLSLKHGVDTRFVGVDPGAFVYSRSTEDYFSLVPPFPVIFLKARKGYLQVTEADEIPLICATKAEVAGLGGTTDRNGRPDLTPFSAFCEALVAIDQSACPDWSGTILFDIAGTRKIAFAEYFIKKSAFSEIGSVLAGEQAWARLAKQKPAPLWKQVWSLGSVLRKGPTFPYQVPTLARLGEVTPAESAALQELAENL
jgi:hypothetical protein